MSNWPKGTTSWFDGGIIYISIPFTWNLPVVKAFLSQASFLWDYALVGGPAVELMPDYFNALPWVEVGHEMPGILQRVNPQATRTTLGCPNRCGFCAIGQGKVEAGGFRELEDWPDLPIICDNNLLASSIEHFDKVIDRLKKHEWCDFNQGLDARLLNEHHAKRFKELHKPAIRLALDSMAYVEQWEVAYDRLRTAGLPKSAIKSYALIGFKDSPDEAWRRCNWIDDHNIEVYPMWHHTLDQLQWNIVREDQKANGWTEAERLNIMGWFYKHRGIKRVA